MMDSSPLLTSKMIPLIARKIGLFLSLPSYSFSWANVNFFGSTSCKPMSGSVGHANMQAVVESQTGPLFDFADTKVRAVLSSYCRTWWP